MTWTNQDSTPHTVTLRDRLKDGGTLREGQSFSYTFTSTGTLCLLLRLPSLLAGNVTVTA